MVYPTLDAVTPPALVQPAPAPILALEVPDQGVTLPSKAAAFSAKNLTAAPVPETQASGLGRAVSLPPPAAPPRFTLTSLPKAIAPESSPEPFFERSVRHHLFDASIKAPSRIELAQNQPISSPAPAPPTPPRSPALRSTPSSFVELSADRQEYNTTQQVVTAVGNVLLNYRTAVLKADRVQTLTLQKRVVAEGRVTLTQGGQVLQGDRLEYQLDQNQGVLYKPTGIINLPAAGSGAIVPNPGTAAMGSNPLVDLKDTLQPPPTAPQPVPQAQEGLQSLRFEADRIEFTSQTWRAVNIRITSDPFSPPELELRAEQAQLQRISAQEDRVTLQRPLLVFDQRVKIPVPRSKITLSRGRENPFRIDIGFDERDRGGLYLGHEFKIVSTPTLTLSLTPQFFLERAIFSRQFNLLSTDVYGLTARLKSEFSPKLTLGAYATLTNIDVTNLADNLRAGLRLERRIGDNRLAFESAYRERFFNGTLGEQTLQSRTGVIFSTPTRALGKTGIELNYRLAAELLTATSDRFGGLDTVSLGRFQGSASLQRAIDLWQGKTLPPTATAGMKYTPQPLQPYLRLVVGLTGVVSGYSNDDSQSSLIGKVRLEGQFGHFSRRTLDYTGFFVGFSQGAQWGESPFLFDRFVDRQVLSAGFLQQVYGPIRVGLQSSLNVETGEFFNTEIILDYSRRTYGISLRYNPNLQVGAIVFRINSFSWVSNPDPLARPEAGVVEAGVGETNRPF